jgi:endonuclease/exonuclease/phosphatase family metal-dependent hydrolase
MKLTAVTFNMQNGQGWDDNDPDGAPVDFTASVNFLRSLEADVYFLQEVERGHDGGMQVQPPPHYTELQAGFPQFASAFAYPPGNTDELPFGLGLAILSRWPLMEPVAHILPAPELSFEFGGRERRPSNRSLLRTTAKLPGADLHLLNTHLQAFFMIGSTSEKHPAQRQCLETLVRALGKGTSLLLGGDFNIGPDEKLVQQMKRTGLKPAQTKEPTWRRRPYVVDHLFASASLTLENCEVIPTETSDHHAVRAVYSVNA